MTDLVAFLGTGKGTSEHVKRVIEGEEWENIFLITDKNHKDSLKTSKKVQFIIINTEKYLTEMVEEIKDKLKGKINGFEVGVNVVSGTGKEHMALLSALLKLGLALRFVALTTKGVKEV